MTLDLKAVEALSELEKAATEGPWTISPCNAGTRMDGPARLVCYEWDVDTPDANYIAALRNAAPELLALAKEALAAREFHAAYKAYQSSGGRDQALLDTAMQRMRDHRELVSAHQSGDGG